MARPTISGASQPQPRSENALNHCLITHRPKATRRGGFYSWDEQDIEKFEATFPVGTRERLALVLLLETAQRRGDVIRKRADHLGTVEATTEKEAIEKAAERFEIPPERRWRVRGLMSYLAGLHDNALR